MPEYLVEWQINVCADTPEEAAREAWRLMRKPDSTANCFRIFAESGEFEVGEYEVDLQELDEANESTA